MVRVIIERHCRPHKDAELEKLLVELRTSAIQQSGYISGETLRSVEDPSLLVVLSTWVDADQWKAWEATPERRKIANEIETLLVAPEKVSVFALGS